jgi:hypothetical protein
MGFEKMTKPFPDEALLHILAGKFSQFPEIV